MGDLTDHTMYEYPVNLILVQLYSMKVQICIYHDTVQCLVLLTLFSIGMGIDNKLRLIICMLDYRPGVYIVHFLFLSLFSSQSIFSPSVHPPPPTIVFCIIYTPVGLSSSLLCTYLCPFGTFSNSFLFRFCMSKKDFFFNLFFPFTFPFFCLPMLCLLHYI